MGDLPGHDFRGNQWTDSQGAAMDRMHGRAKADEAMNRMHGRGISQDALERMHERANAEAKVSRGDYLEKIPSDANPTGQFTREGVAALAKFEEQARERKTEYAQIQAADGKVLLQTTSGSPKQVLFSPRECMLMNNAVLAHNHPSGSTISVGDVELAVTRNLREIRAVGSEGTYRIARTGDTWPKGTLERVTRSAADVRKAFIRDMRSGPTLPSPNAQREQWRPRIHAAMENAVNGNKGYPGIPGVHYSFTPRKR